MTTAEVFAYGSNLLTKQMVKRCPTAEFLGHAHLAKHELGFVGWSTGWRSSVATVLATGNKADKVAGVVYMVSKDDLLRLDGFEGAPGVYVRKAKLVTMEGWGRRYSRRVWVYMHNSALLSPPGYGYFAACVAGRAEHGLDAGDVTEAAQRALTYWSATSAISRAVG